MGESAQATITDTTSAGFPVIVRIGSSGFATEVRASGHIFRADEPKSFGGTDTGPSPYDYLLASLGTCTAMTLRVYADRKGWPLEAVNVSLAHHRIHSNDCNDCESESGFVTKIERSIKLEGDLDEEQKTRLLEVADRCPVHRALTSEIKITTTS